MKLFRSPRFNYASKKHPSRIQLSLSALALLFLFGCQGTTEKKEGLTTTKNSDGTTVTVPSSDGATSQGLEILQYVPTKSLGFARVDLSKKELQTLTAVAMKQMSKESITKQLENNMGSATPEEKAKLEETINSLFKIQDPLIKSGLFPSESGPGTATEILATLTANVEQKELAVGSVVKLNTSAESAITKLTASLTENKVKFENKDGLVTIDTEKENEKVFVRSGKNLLAISNKKDIAAQMLEPAPSTAEVVTTATSKIPNLAQEAVAVFADFRGFFKEAKTLDAAKEGNAAMSDIAKSLSSTFIETAYFTVNPEQGLLRTNGAVDFDPKNPQLVEVITKLGGSDNASSDTAMPNSQKVAFALNLNKNLVATALDQMAKLPEFVGSAEYQQALPILQKLGSLSFGLVKGSVSSPYPEIYFASKTTSQAELLAQLKGLFDMAGPLIGAAPSWQEKTIGNIKAEFKSTPIGIGVYLASTPSGIVISTGENAIEAQTVANSGETGVTDAGLLTKIKSVDSSLASFYTDGAKLAGILHDVNSAVAPFTGGKSAIEPTTLDQMRSQKESFVSLLAGKNAVLLQGWSVQ
jgi:hypothetical protein